MKELLWLMRKTFRTTFRNKFNILLYVIGPMLGIVVALLAFGEQGDDSISVGVVNNDQELMAEETIRFIKEQDNLMYQELSEDEVSGHLANGTVEAVVTLNEGYSDSIVDGNPDHIEITTIMGESVTSVVRDSLYQYIDRLVIVNEATDGDEGAFIKMLKNYQSANFSVEVVSKDTSGNVVSISAIGFLLVIMMFSAVNLSEIIQAEKENRTYFRLLSTPITARTYTVSNIIVNMIVMSLQVIITLCALLYVFNIDLGMGFWQAFVILWLFSFIAIGMSLVIVAYSKSRNMTGALANLIILPTIMLSGGFWPAEIMPDVLQKISKFLPQRWVLDTLESLQQGDSLGSLYLNIGILMSFALALFIIAIYKMNRNNSTQTFV